MTRASRWQEKQRLWARAVRRQKLIAIVRALDALAEREAREPRTHEEARMMSARRIYLLDDRWRGCREPICKRHHLCCTPRGFCSNAPPPEPLSENARRLIDRLWRRRLARAAPAPSAAG